MRRRDFLKASCAAAVTGFFSKNLFAETKPAVISVSEGKDYEQITRNVINALGGMRRFVKKGDIVVVKPNIGWDRKPEYAANTHPLVVRAIVMECLKAGAKKVKVFDRTCNDPRRSYDNSGITEALQNIKNVDLKHIDYDRFKRVTLNGVFLKDWELYDEALSADVYINVPIAKHHGLTKLTLSLKNVMGIMGGNRGYIHRNIENALADIHTVFKTTLNILDATRILLDNGPQGGNLKDVKILNKVLASTDKVALDAYATTLFKLNPEDISITKVAYKRGLGEMNLSKVNVIKA